MSDGERPGGLTVLAVLSFIWSGLELIGNGYHAFMTLVGRAAEIEGPLADAEPIPRWTLIAGGLLGSAVLLVAAIGFLGQRRITGRVMGSVYALLTVGVLLAVQTIEPRLFMFGTVISIVYSLLILLLVNTTFRHDLVR